MIVLAIHLSLNGAFLSVDFKENMFRKFIVCVVCLFKKVNPTTSHSSHSHLDLN